MAPGTPRCIELFPITTRHYSPDFQSPETTISSGISEDDSVQVRPASRFHPHSPSQNDIHIHTHTHTHTHARTHARTHAHTRAYTHNYKFPESISHAGKSIIDDIIEVSGTCSFAPPHSLHTHKKIFLCDFNSPRSKQVLLRIWIMAVVLR